MQPLGSGVRIGRHQLIERLGGGGMGEVWLAWRVGAGRFRRRVVLKLVSPEWRENPEVLEALAKEAHLLGALHHPSIVSAIDYVDDPVRGPVLVLEHVDGLSLRQVLKRCLRSGIQLGEGLAVHIGLEVARALAFAHDARDEDGNPLALVHRDVSPDNVLLSRHGKVKLADFGVATQAWHRDEGEEGLGKRGYSPPEQLRGDTVGPQADVFSLGRVIAEAADVTASPALQEVLRKATAERPRDRYASCDEFARALALACPPPPLAQDELAQALARISTEASSTPLPGDLGEPARRARASAPPEVRYDSFAGVSRVGARGPRWMVAFAAAAAACVVALGFLIRRAEPAASRPPRTGLVVIRSHPADAEIYVDGALRGMSPVTLRLSAGRHRVHVGPLRAQRCGNGTLVDVSSETKVQQVDLTCGR